MSELDLDIQNYNLIDILRLFKLNYHFGEPELKQAYRIALKTHPDKSNLAKEYFIFFMKAYKIIEDIYKFRHKSEIYEKNNSRYMTNVREDMYSAEQEALLAKIKGKGDNDFNKWFNELFNSVKITDEEQDTGYETWFRDKSDQREQSNVSKAQFGMAFEKEKQNLQSMVKYEGVNELYSGSGSVTQSNLSRQKISDYSSDIFSKLNYEDLKKAHTETVVPVTQQDFANHKKFNSLEDLQIHRGAQKISSLSMNQSRQFMRQRQQTEDKINTERAFHLISQDEKIRQTQDKIWTKLRLLSDK